jgi:hypothetical protein
MVDKPLFNLDADGRWRLAYESNQWVLQRRVGSSGTDRSGNPDSGWRGVSFVGGKKATPGRSFREKGRCPDCGKPGPLRRLALAHADHPHKS